MKARTDTGWNLPLRPTARRFTFDVAERALHNNQTITEVSFPSLNSRISEAAIDLFWLAGLGWCFLRNKMEPVRVNGYSDLYDIHVNVALAYFSKVPTQYLPDHIDVLNPRNVPIYQMFDRNREPQRPQMAAIYTTALNELLSESMGLAKLVEGVEKEEQLIRDYLHPPKRSKWLFWGTRSDDQLDRMHEIIELWLGGWEAQSQERKDVWSRIESTLKYAESLVEDAHQKGDLAMTEWSNLPWDQW